jgi:hypothetical protein
MFGVTHLKSQHTEGRGRGIVSSRQTGLRDAYLIKQKQYLTGRGWKDLCPSLDKKLVSPYLESN